MAMKGAGRHLSAVRLGCGPREGGEGGSPDEMR